MRITIDTDMLIKSTINAIHHDVYKGFCKLASENSPVDAVEGILYYNKLMDELGSRIQDIGKEFDTDDN